MQQLTLTEFFGFFGIIAAIISGVWVFSTRFSELEVRVGRLEVRMDRLEEKVEKLALKVDEILLYLAPKYKRKKKKHQKD
ncbi:MAG TPA: hypothetical protein VF473_03245 [Cyclobacteriaceae bacterium]